MGLFSSPEILDEFAGVVARNRFAERLSRLSTTPDEAAMRLYQLANIVVPIVNVRSVIEDEDDLMFLACASEVQADFLISGDKHLLELGSYRNTKIASIREWFDKHHLAE